MKIKSSISSGSIGWMAQNSVAANLLMFVLIVGGLLLFQSIKQEVFPEFSLDIITVTVVSPGASPVEMEKGVVLAVEEAVQNLDGVDEVTATASEGVATIVIEALDDYDGYRLLQDIKSEVDRITTFPESSEKPSITLITTRHEVLDLILTGSDNANVLREWAEIVRDELIHDPAITIAELDRVRDHEIIVEISQDNLRRYNLTIEDISKRINESALELGGGTLKTSSGDIMVKLNERRDYASEFNNIAISTSADGHRLLLEDIAVIKDDFEESKRWFEYNGKPAIFIEVFRIGNQTPQSISKAALKVVARLNATMPEPLTIHVLRNTSDVFEERANLLVNNAILGVILVFLSLALFLKPSLAFWVSMGIPASILGSFIFLATTDMSINVISMFAFILTLGIVVDDAIVVGENICTYQEKGYDPLEASILGTREVSGPVIFSVLTNIFAFVPMFFIPGIMGKIWGVIPLVVIAVFTCSLVESLYILPAHLVAKKTKPVSTSQLNNKGLWAKFKAMQQSFSKKFLYFVEYRYGTFINHALNNRYLVMALGISLLLIVLSYAISGRMGFDLMPRTEADFAYVNAVAPSGVAQEDLTRIATILLENAELVVKENGGEALATGIFTKVDENEVSVRIYLVPVDDRPIGTTELTNLWREKVGNIVGIEHISFESDKGGPGSGKGISVNLSHRNTEILEEASRELAEKLRAFSSVQDIDSGTSLTKRQFEIKLTPLAEQLGLSSRSVATQLRYAFEGKQVLRQQRGRNEVTVRVRLPEEDRRNIQSFENLIIKTPQGQEVLLRDVVEIIDGRDYAVIRHTDGRRTSTITANVNPPSQINLLTTDLREKILPELVTNYSGLSWEFSGRQADIKESADSILMGFVMVLIAIYTLLAIPFKSYTQPLIIMTAIPFGLIGAIGGHFIMGYNLSVISMFGVVALAGVVVNDSLVLIDFANRRRAEGLDAFQAIRQAGIQRFRPIILTTVTTFVGLAPMIFETSRQARMLIPVALSLGFGILFATVICLIFVPALYLILEDAQDFVKEKFNIASE